MSDMDKKENMYQETYMIQELCERGDLQKQRPEAKAQTDKDYLRWSPAEALVPSV